jgi:hypothetical protein
VKVFSSTVHPRSERDFGPKDGLAEISAVRTSSSRPGASSESASRATVLPSQLQNTPKSFRVLKRGRSDEKDCLAGFVEHRFAFHD